MICALCSVGPAGPQERPPRGAQPTARRLPVARTAVNVAQHETARLLKAFYLLISFHQGLCVYCVAQGALLPVRPRDAGRLDPIAGPILQNKSRALCCLVAP